MIGSRTAATSTQTAPRAPWWTQAHDLNVMELPTDYPLSSRYDYRERCHSFVWEDWVEQLAAVGSSERVALCLGVVQTWLRHYAKQQDQLLGVQIVGEDPQPLALRTHFQAFNLFSELMHHNEAQLEAMRDQPLDLAELALRLEMSRPDGHPELCPVIFRFGADPESAEQVARHPRYLTLELWVADQGLAGQIRYSADLFADVSVARMEKQLNHVFELLLADRQQDLGSLNIMPEAEMRLLMETWLETDREYDRELPLHRRFEAVARERPELTAVIFEGEQLNYGQLNQRANRLARHLVARGVQLDQPVGVYMARCLESVVAYVAILKAGGVYLPLDASFPMDRLELMLEETAAPVIITHDAQGATVPSSSAEHFNFDRDAHLLEAYDVGDLSLQVPSAIGSYIVYTSGSTGKPKGVFTTHHALLNFIVSMQDRNPLGHDDRFLYKTSCCFDPAIMETTWPLLYGAAIVVAKPEGHKDNAYLVRLIQEQRVTAGFTVPSALIPFFDEPGAARCTSLRNFFTGGEAVPLAVAERFYEIYDAQLHNIYGPAETTVIICMGNCRTKGIRTVPFGHAINNIKLYVLAEDGRPCPIGLSGELYISGESLGRGYIQRAGITAERFIPDPFTDRPGSRMYKTGDVVRYRTNGELEFMGRNDAQIKIRGFRIELGEIESAIGRHPKVQSAVVVVHETEAGDKQLVAHMVLDSNQVDKAEIREFLKQKLPEYMVPSHFIAHESLPRTATGKLDRSKLPAPAQERPELDEPYVAPGSPMECTVAGIWEEVLQIEGIGINDNFMDLGGHSLSAVKVISTVRTQLGIELSLVALLESPTIASFAAALLNAQGESSAP